MGFDRVIARPYGWFHGVATPDSSERMVTSDVSLTTGRSADHCSLAEGSPVRATQLTNSRSLGSVEPPE